MLIVGLGNPGDRYAQTRHNIGFMVVDQLGERWQLSLNKKGHQAFWGQGRRQAEPVILLKPQTFMNLSGASVASACKAFGCEPGQLLVVHDDLDLPFGQLRIKQGGGHGGHNGLRHIIKVLGTSDFFRLRLGIGRPGEGEEVVAYVLRAFTAEQKQQVVPLLQRASEAIEAIVDMGVARAMCAFNGQNSIGN
ncbi:MAG: aminoacyl-tRNA hydrolase [Desulfuromonas thiophila]|jgi:PTH1 family peptidyl-tRNA hydrolase|nr:aminoacyl-tRNA hydrolase [Desulfuromonas thiophila]